MRILMSTNISSTIPPDNYDATNVVISNLVKGLLDKGHSVILLCKKGSSISHSNLEKIEIDNPILSEGDNIFHNIESQKMYYLYQILPYIDSTQYDIFHIHDEIVYTHLTYSDIDLPLVLTLHTDKRIHYGRIPTQKKFNIVNNIDKSLYLVPISSNQYERHKHLSQTINYVYNGLDISGFSYNDIKEDFYLYAGRLNKEKGFHHVINTFTEDSGLSLKVAGIRGDKRLESEYDLDSFFNQINVEFLGVLPRSELKTYYSNAKGFIHLADWEEPFGLTVVESLASGTPVLTTSNGAPKEIVEDGVTGIVESDYRDYSVVRNRLQELDSLDNLACRESVESKFDKSYMVSGYEEIYQKIVDGVL